MIVLLAGRSVLNQKLFQILMRFWGLHDDFHLLAGRGAVESLKGVSVREDV